MVQVIFGRSGGRLWLSGFLRLAALLGGLALAPLAPAESPLKEGSWNTLPYLLPISPIHCGVTHTGKIIIVFHPADQTWSLAAAQTVYKRTRSWGSVVLLPLRSEQGYAAKVLSMGGDFPATSSAEIIAPAATPAPRGEESSA